MSLNNCHELGEEMASDANVWTEYVQEAEEFDSNLLGAWNRTTDVMLVFAALFSAVLTAFLVESIKQLSPDPQDMTNTLLLSIYNNLKSQSITNSSVPALVATTESNFLPSKSALWINGLWFTSLTCSLGVGSVAMLVKQWLNAYVFGLSATPHLRAQARQHRYDAFIAWRTGHIINSLPLAMSFCLMLFLGGLSIMLLSLSRPIAFTSIAIIVVTFVFHLLNLILPAICHCPWKTALSPVMFRLFAPLRRRWPIPSRAQFCHWTKLILRGTSPVWGIFVVLFLACFGIVYLMASCVCVTFRTVARLTCISDATYDMIKSVLNGMLSALECILSATGNVLVTSFHSLLYLPCRRLSTTITNLWRSPSEADHEERVVQNQSSVLAARAILWLLHTSTKQAIVNHSAQAISGLPADTNAALVLYQSGAPQILRDHLQSCFRGKELKSPKEAEMYARGLLRLHVTLRILNEGRELESCRDDALLARALSISPSTESRPAIIACLCAGAMLHEMVEALEQHTYGVNPLSPFQVYLLVDTLGQEIAWRKRPADNHWTNLSLGNWGGLLPRALPVLIHLLDPQSSSSSGTGDPLLVDTAISFTIAMFTQGHPAVNVRLYMKESCRKMHFYYLIMVGLAPILRFPESFGCNKELVDVARAKFNVAARLFARNQRSMHLLDRSAFQDLMRWPSMFSHESGDLVFCLTLMETEIIATLDCRTLLRVLPSISPTGMCRVHFLDLFKRMCEECSRDEEFVRTGITRLLSEMVRSPASNACTKSRAFSVLIRISYQLRASSDSSIQTMIDQDLLGVLREFFLDTAFVGQDDVDRCMITLSDLCKSHPSAVAESGVIKALMNWTHRYWRNTELMFKHKDTLATMASLVHGTFALWEDTSWFSPTPSSPLKRDMLSRG